MIEWFASMGRWFMEHKDAIILFFTSGQAVSLLGAIILLVRNTKATKNNTSSSKILNESIAKTDVLSTTTDDVKNNTDTLLKNDSAQEKRFDDIENTMEILTGKMNTLLEVLTIVYSTIKDEKVRSTVNSLLVNAKYSENSTRAELQRQIAELKAVIKSQLEQLDKDVDEKVESVTKTVNGEVSTGEVPMRY